jgi:hypothetical protein
MSEGQDEERQSEDDGERWEGISTARTKTWNQVLDSVGVLYYARNLIQDRLRAPVTVAINYYK